MPVDSLHRDWWESFCHQHEKTEEEVKSLLFKGELSNKEFETLVDCATVTTIAKCKSLISFSRVINSLAFSGSYCSNFSFRSF